MARYVKLKGKIEPTRCQGCGRPVHDTVNNCGFCRKCIAKEKAVSE